MSGAGAAALALWQPGLGSLGSGCPGSTTESDPASRGGGQEPAAAAEASLSRCSWVELTHSSASQDLKVFRSTLC